MSSPLLSEREQELLILVTTGASNKEISKQLNISINTVKVHLRNIYTKLEVTSRTEAAMWAVQNGLVHSRDKEELFDNDTQQRHESIIRRFFRTRSLNIVILIFLTILIILGFGIRQVILISRQAKPTQTNNELAMVIEESKWKQLSDMTTARSGMAVVVYEDYLYVIGGESGQGVVNTTERYNLQTDDWEILPPKAIAVSDMRAGVIGGKIYVVGGRLSKTEVSDIIEIFDPEKGTWSRGLPLPEPLSGYGMTTFEGKLFIFGGWNGQQYSKSVYMYEPNLNSWSERTSMPFEMSDVFTVLVNDLIYVLGNDSANREKSYLLKFNPVSDSAGISPWELDELLTQDWVTLGVENVAGNIYILSSDNPDIVKIHEFDTNDDEWREIRNSIRPPIIDFGTVAVGPAITLVGGEIDGVVQTQMTSYQVIYTISIPIVR